MSPKNSPVACDGSVKYEEAEVDRLAILLQNNEKKMIRLGILDFISAKFVMDYPCVIPYILFYIHGPAISLCF